MMMAPRTLATPHCIVSTATHLARHRQGISFLNAYRTPKHFRLSFESIENDEIPFAAIGLSRWRHIFCVAIHTPTIFYRCDADRLQAPASACGSKINASR
mmetsp:Transcript_12438/g.26472  ORF Transcript_12438/g.26472 Transcript_12438/m.26472 type:complete len:100 (+) Transcript_12438:3-302(+)